MRRNRLRELQGAGITAVNAWISCDSPYIAEVFSHAGYDAVTVDVQHGMFDVDRAISLLQAISTGPAVPLARCTRLDPAQIGKLLDAGAYGVICPSIDTPEQCAELVAACRYPPSGRRSFGPARGLIYGGSDYVDGADATVQTWAMIESGEALARLADIIAVPGLDGVYVGPNDLALSLGVRPGTVPVAAEVEDALAEVLRAADRAGVAAGAFCSDVAMARRLAAAGFDLVTPGNDVSLLRDAAAQRLAVARGTDEAESHGGGY